MAQDTEKFLHEAESYERLRDELGRDQIENHKFLKGQVADWYIAITAACFAIGGVSISLAGDDIKHPALFWWGSVLLIVNGVLIFFVRMAELNGEFSESPDLKQKEADLWTMAEVTREHAQGNNSRKADFKQAFDRFLNDYNKRSKAFKWWAWVMFAIRSAMLNVAFGLLLFPTLLLAPQLPNHLHITLHTYTWIMVISLVAYLIYVGVEIFKSVSQKKAIDRANLQIKSEVTR
jgi:hypothetical protein